MIRLSFNNDNVFVLQLEKEVEQNKNFMKISIKRRKTLKLILSAVLLAGED